MDTRSRPDPRAASCPAPTSERRARSRDSDLEEFRRGLHHSAPRSTHTTAEAGHFTNRGPAPTEERAQDLTREGPTRSRTATGPPRPPRELPKASSKGEHLRSPARWLRN